MSRKSDLAQRALAQDRYSIRTASQWIGPVLEDCLAAYCQIMIDCNSVTDNPLSDAHGNSLQGGNFQSKAVTSAMEKARQGLQSLGRMLFSQCTEMINPATSNGLPPNLTVDPPSQSFIMKGIDVFCASIVSELGFLANPVGTHVQTAEMGNQAINSLALISARYTHTAADLLSKLCAAHLLIVCQAIDLRALSVAFWHDLKVPFHDLTFKFWSDHPSIDQIFPLLESSLSEELDGTIGQDSDTRFKSIVSSLQFLIFTHSKIEGYPPLSDRMNSWGVESFQLLKSQYHTSRTIFLDNGIAKDLLGRGTIPMYNFVRQSVRVPFLHEDLFNCECSGLHGNAGEVGCKSSHQTIGDYVTRLHKAVRQGMTNLPATESLQEMRTTTQS